MKGKLAFIAAQFYTDKSAEEIIGNVENAKLTIHNGGPILKGLPYKAKAKRAAEAADEAGGGKISKKQYRFNPAQMSILIMRIVGQKLEGTDSTPFCRKGHPDWYTSMACQLLSLELNDAGEKIYATCHAALSAPKTKQTDMAQRVYLFIMTNLGNKWIKWMKAEGHVLAQKTEVIKKLKAYHTPDVGSKSTEAPWLRPL